MKPKLRKALVFIGSLILGGVVGFAAVKLLVQPGSANRPSAPLHYKLAILPILIICFFLVIAIHEIGHVVAGKIVGFRFRALTVGPLMWEKEGSGVRFKWNKNLNAYGGLALCLPPDTRNLVRRFVGFTAGGPLASLLLALVGFAGLRVAVPAEPSFANYILEFFWLMCFALSAIITLVTLIPMRSGGFLTDGARMIQLLKGGPKATIDVVCLQTIALAYSGVRPRDLNPAPLTEAVGLPVASPFKTYLHAFLYLHYLDAGATEMAGEHLQQYTATAHEVPKGYRAVIYLENVWYEAMCRFDAAKASMYLQQAELGAFIPKSLVYRAEAGLAFAEGDFNRATEKASAALQELSKSIDRGSAVAEWEWLEALLAACTSGGKVVFGDQPQAAGIRQA